MIRVILPMQLCTQANVERYIKLQVEDPATIATVLEELEA